MTATLDELKEALIETLDNRGVLGQVKAKVRAEIFAALDDEQIPRPQLPRENVIINELIREYLEYNGYHHTLSVLLPESGHPEEHQFNRQFLAGELRLQDNERSGSLPLIYSLVRGLRPQTSAVAEAYPIETVRYSGGEHVPAEATAPTLMRIDSTGLAPSSLASALPSIALQGPSLHDPSLRGVDSDLGNQAEPLVIRGGSEVGVSCGRAWDQPAPLSSLT